MKNFTAIYENENGLTLLETVLYLALFAVLFVVVLEFTMAVAESNRGARARGDVETSIMFIVQHVEDSFTEASSVDSLNSVFYSDNGDMRLVSSSGTARYYLDAGQLQFVDGGITTPLTGPHVSVDRFYFEEILDRHGDISGVRCILGISSVKEDASEEIETAFSL